MLRSSSASPLLEVTSLCAAWLQRVGGVSCSNHVVAALLPMGPQRGLAGRPDVRAESTNTYGSDLPPPWIPPPENPLSLKPKPVITTRQVLELIAQANTPLEIHNAYRRRPAHLPPAIAAAKFTRLSQLLRSHPDAAAAANPTHPPTDPTPSSPPASSSPSRAAPAHVVAWRGTLERMVGEIETAWDTQLQLFSAKQLAACVRAACETRLTLPPEELAAAVAAGGPGAERRGAKSLWLLQRTLDVLLDEQGRELEEAGPKAILDVSYGLMLVEYDRAEVWRSLGPLLRRAHQELSTPFESQQVLEVLAWLEGKGFSAGVGVM